jgi:hypothetical protein
MTAHRKKLVTLSLIRLLAISPAPVAAQAVLFHEQFARPNGLITNDFATFHPDSTAAKVSNGWIALSGSLFAVGKAGWTGVPDAQEPVPGKMRPTGATRSAALRLVTQLSDIGDAAVSFNLYNQGLTSGPAMPAKPYDGVHVLLRYQDDNQFYVVSVSRRDNTISIKKKGPNGYVDLSPDIARKARYDKWQRVTVAVRNTGESVTIQAYLAGKLVATALDDGMNGPALRGAGKVGLRGDNCEFLFDDFKVTSLPPAGAPQAW